MKYLILSIVFCFGFMGTGLSQDTLYTVRGEKILMNLVEINQTHIKYRLTDPKIKEVFTIPINEVIQIVFTSGFVKTFSDKETQFTYLPVSSVDPYALEFGQHFISLNVLDASVGPLTLGYEHTLKSGEFGIYGHVSKGMNRGNELDNHWDENKDYSFALSFNYYPSGQGKFQSFFGPSFEYGKLSWEYSYDIETIKYETSYTAFVFQMGWLIQLSPHFNWSIIGGLGYASGDRYLNQLVARSGFLVGYKF